MGLENPLHIIMILLVVLLVFGAKRLPEMGRGLGDGMRGFRDAMSGQHSEPAGISAAQTHTHHEAAAPVVVSQPAVVAEPVGAVASND
jgi:sec-independent protein translocase protein TatA